jgi:glycerophosphoryl diester phosphodiesterase
MSMLAYRNAVAQGVDALEVSLARTSDGVWFGLHDRTLDRTSGTVAFVAAEHTWAEVSRYKISGGQTHTPLRAAQPYLRFEDLVTAYGSSHTLFVDPKYVSPAFYPELLRMVDSRVPNLKQTLVAKGYCTSVGWAQLARRNGLASWGYYYASTIQSNPSLLRSTQADWSLLGLDYNGSAAVWEQFHTLGKPIVGHVIPSKAAAHRARSLGAHGLMISGIREVLA